MSDAPHDAGAPLVKVYTSRICGYCSAAKRLLAKREIPFEEIDLTNQPELRMRLSQQTGMRTVPMIFIGDACIGGYTELAALEASGELEARLAALAA
jgi:glutaredoxin 3